MVDTFGDIKREWLLEDIYIEESHDPLNEFIPSTKEETKTSIKDDQNSVSENELSSDDNLVIVEDDTKGYEIFVKEDLDIPPFILDDTTSSSASNKRIDVKKKRNVGTKRPKKKVSAQTSEMCIIEVLLEERFSKTILTERQSIINNGRPTPKLPNLRTFNKTCIRSFQTNLYEKKKWLTGSTKLNKLFCWACLLYNQDNSIWNLKGYDDLNNVHMAMLKHERAKRHIKSMIELNTFKNVHIDLELDVPSKLSLRQHNEKVKRNRCILRRLIDTVIFLGGQGLSFRSDSDTLNNRGNYKELLYLISKYDEKLENHLDTGSIFSDLSNSIQNDLIDAIEEVMLDEIKLEIEQAKFVAILQDETYNASSNYLPRLSTVFRYVTKECVAKERFIGFVTTDHSADALSEHIFKCIETWKCEEKLVAQCYDGSAVMPGQLDELQLKVRGKYKSALFIYCYAHLLNIVLPQACSTIKECKIFFSTINGLGSFLTRSSKGRNALDNIVKNRFPDAPAPIAWTDSSSLVNNVKQNQDSLVVLFEDIIKNPEGWDEATLNDARGFFHSLNDPEFLLLLEVFSDIFSITLNLLSHKKQVGKTRIILENKLEEFSTFYKMFEKKYYLDSTNRASGYGNKCINPQLHYGALYDKVISTVIDQLKIRFSSLEDVQFIELINFKSASKFSYVFPAEVWNSLIDNYGNFFHITRLQNELNILYEMETFVKKDISNIMPYISVNDLTDTLSEVFKLCNLYWTIPFKTVSANPSFSALERIKTYQRITTRENRRSGLALMSIERDLLQHLSKSEDFYDKVTNKFALKDQTIELMYK